ncbi:hypothetical protein G4B88_005792 [Cannabis sativa]|uniref:V-type proton ATPase subunit S1/VOA1 transmembrane domain-containing protein n=3 Tax=Cannabis sativa TaxID=3483 RepID=A0A7J6GSU7_CANSA|nr:hypothetical protein G4B88_005792 [Cannabis sativa]
MFVVLCSNSKFPNQNQNQNLTFLHLLLLLLLGLSSIQFNSIQSIKDTKLKMKKAPMAVLLLLLLSALIPSGSSSTVPAFLWSSHRVHPSSSSVNYQTLSPKDLAKSLLSQPGWSHLLCSEDQVKQSLDLALIFVGSQLQSSDLFANTNADKDFVDFLKVSFTKSNFSTAYPYIAATEDSMADSLLQGVTETCGNNINLGNIVVSESCSLPDGNFNKLANVQSVRDYLSSRTEKRANGEADVVVFCHEDSNSLDNAQQSHSEAETFGELVGSMDQSGEKYAVLYVSTPSKSIQYPLSRDVERFLAEGTNSTICGEVCKIKSSLLEGLLVGIVLLIILVSGICCMMGIDTPTRFETPQDS